MVPLYFGLSSFSDEAHWASLFGYLLLGLLAWFLIAIRGSSDPQMMLVPWRRELHPCLSPGSSVDHCSSLFLFLLARKSSLGPWFDPEVC